MEIRKLSDFKGGWFIGNFEPSLFTTKEFECAVKEYKAGDAETAHYHSLATEITLIVSGTAEMNGKRYSKGDVIIIDKNETTDFLAITDVITTVVKFPSVTGDKYLAEV